MRLIKLALCLTGFLVYFFISLFVCRKRRVLSRLIRFFDRYLLFVLNIKVKVSGPRPDFSKISRGAFLVSNHLSYVDGFVLGAIFPLLYISKADLKKWPLIGSMSEVAGTIFIDRQKKSGVADSIASIVRALGQRVNVLFFPEGTSTNGEGLKPFKSAFFQAPIMASAPIVPLSIVYRSIDGRHIGPDNRDLVYWYGDMTFVDHFFRLLGARRVDVEVKLHKAIIAQESVDEGMLRKRVSEAAYEVIAQDIHSIKNE